MSEEYEPSAGEIRFARERFAISNPVMQHMVDFAAGRSKSGKLAAARISGIENIVPGRDTVRGEIVGCEFVFPQPDSAEVWEMRVTVWATEAWATMVTIKTSDGIDETFEADNTAAEAAKKVIDRIAPLLRALPI
jgi:hypothetical protein